MNKNSTFLESDDFDEYEAILALLQQDLAQGERLLAAMRSFLQQQNKRELSHVLRKIQHL